MRRYDGFQTEVLYAAVWHQLVGHFHGHVTTDPFLHFHGAAYGLLLLLRFWLFQLGLVLPNVLRQLLRVEVVLAVDLQEFRLADRGLDSLIGRLESIDLWLSELELLI